MKKIKRKNRMHRTSSFIFLFILIIFPSIVHSRSLEDGENYQYRSVLANPVVSRSYAFLSINNPRTFGGNVGGVFHLYSRGISHGHFNLSVNASIHSLTHRNKTKFYLQDVDYLLGANTGYYLPRNNIWFQFSLEHISSHLGDSYFLDTEHSTENRKPIIFSLEFVRFSVLKNWGNFKLEGGIAYVYHTTQKIPKKNGFVGIEKDIFSISPSVTMFSSMNFSYSLTEVSVLQQVYQIGAKLNFPNMLPLVLAFEVKKGRFFWGQFYQEKLTDYQIQLYLNF